MFGETLNAPRRALHSMMKNHGIAMASALALAALCGTAPRASAQEPKNILRVDRSAAPTENGKYPAEYIVKTKPPFDGSYSTAVVYTSNDQRFVVDVWQSGPGIFKIDDYPHDEYCLV